MDESEQKWALSHTENLAAVGKTFFFLNHKIKGAVLPAPRTGRGLPGYLATRAAVPLGGEICRNSVPAWSRSSWCGDNWSLAFLGERAKGRLGQPVSHQMGNSNSNPNLSTHLVIFYSSSWYSLPPLWNLSPLSQSTCLSIVPVFSLHKCPFVISTSTTFAFNDLNSFLASPSMSKVCLLAVPWHYSGHIYCFLGTGFLFGLRCPPS